MLPATLLLQTQEPTPPKPVAGIVRAFAVYIDPECLPGERAGTVYVARTLNDDGSTITVVRAFPDNAHPTYRNYGHGQATIFRDPQGKATRIESRLEMTPPPGHDDIHLWTLGIWKVDPKKGGPLEGSVENSWGRWPSATLAERSVYVDPIEAIAFDPPAAGAAWLTPPTTPGPRTGRLVFPTAIRYRVLPGHMAALPLQGRTEALRAFPILREWLGTPSRPPQAHAGMVAYHLDGTLAVFVPWYDTDSYASRALLQGGFGKSGPNSGGNVAYGMNNGYYVPIPAPRASDESFWAFSLRGVSKDGKASPKSRTFSLFHLV